MKKWQTNVKKLSDSFILFGIEFIVLKTELLENRLIVWDLDDSKKLFGQGYYGKPIGIPKPKLDEINVPLILDLIEGYYLMSKSKIQIYKNKKENYN